MQFDWPTQEQMIYRLHRLRRLLLCAAGLPICVLLLGAVIDPSFMTPDKASLAAMAVLMLIAGHVVLFPNVPLETIAVSLSLTVVILVAPWIKMLSVMAPAEHVNAALVILMGFTLLAAGALTFVFQFIAGMLMMVGPVLKWNLRATLVVECAPNVASSQFVLRPDMRRGRIMTGSADLNGFFDVAILAPQIADPEQPSQPMVMRVAARTMDSGLNSQKTMLVLPNGVVTVTAESFVATRHGCRVDISELPGDFTFGMHVMFWLTDQQMDNLVETADNIHGIDARANGLAHGVSFLSLAAAVLSPRQPVVDRAE